MSFVCKYCGKKFSSQSSLCNHIAKNRCEARMQRTDSDTIIPVTKTGPGRPSKAEIARRQNEAEARAKANGTSSNEKKRPKSPSESEYDVTSDVEDLLYANPNEKYDPVTGIVRKKVRVKERMPDWMMETFEKAKELISDGLGDEQIRKILKWERCFKRDPNDLRKSLNQVIIFLFELYVICSKYIIFCSGMIEQLNLLSVI